MTYVYHCLWCNHVGPWDDRRKHTCDTHGGSAHLGDRRFRLAPAGPDGGERKWSVEDCRRHGVQMCDVCPEGTCGDNTNPALKEKAP